MATLKQRLHRKNSSGTYDTIHLETSADCITGTLAITNGGTGATSAANARSNLGAAASSHNHSASQITSGTLSVARGGTGVTSIDALKSALGIDDSSQSGVTMKLLFEIGTLYNPFEETVADLNSSVSVGSVVIFDGILWRVVHKSGSVVYLASLYRLRGAQFDSSGSNAYRGSDLANVAMNYQNNSMSSGALAQCNNITVNGVTAKVFVCSYEQANGGFSYFSNDRNRILYSTIGDAQTWWTSSAGYSSNVWYIDSSGNLLDRGNPTSPYGFRPFVALQL